MSTDKLAKGNLEESILRSIFSCLKSDHPHKPLKFQYIGEGTARFERLWQYESYISALEMNILTESSGVIAEKIVKSIGSREDVTGKIRRIRLVDLGCGNGRMAKQLACALKDQFERSPFRVSLSYYAIDISPEMLTSASSTMSAVLGRSAIETRRVDFEAEDLAHISQGETIDFIFLLGNTLGNQEGEGAYLSLVRNIAPMAKKGDFLLLGVEMAAEGNNLAVTAEEVAQPYRSKYSKQFVSTALSYFDISPCGPDQHRGCDGNILAEFTPSDSAIHQYFRFTRSKDVFYAGESISFREGDTIELAVSRRFTAGEVDAVCAQAGCRILGEWESISSKVILTEF